MALSYTTLRRLWAPPCKPAKVDTSEAYAALDAWFRHYSYAPREQDTGAQNCRQVTGGSGWSMHAYAFGALYRFWNALKVAMALAIDVNWQTNPYGPKLITDMPRPMVDAILRVRTRNGKQVWQWGGYYRGNKDAMHYEIVCSPADLLTGIDQSTLPGGTPASPGGFLMALSDKQQEELLEIARGLSFLAHLEHQINNPNGVRSNVEGFPAGKPVSDQERWARESVIETRKVPEVLRVLASQGAKIDALTTAIKTIARSTADGVGVDVDALIAEVEAAAERGVQKGLAGAQVAVEATLTLNDLADGAKVAAAVAAATPPG